MGFLPKCWVDRKLDIPNWKTFSAKFKMADFLTKFLLKSTTTDLNKIWLSCSGYQGLFLVEFAVLGDAPFWRHICLKIEICMGPYGKDFRFSTPYLRSTTADLNQIWLSCSWCKG